MKQNTIHKKLYRLFIFMIGLFVFVSKPVIETTNLLLGWDYEIAQVDFDNDFDGKETQEKEINEKDLIQNINDILIYAEENLNIVMSYGAQKPYLNFVLEIPIPPPELG